MKLFVWALENNTRPSLYCTIERRNPSGSINFYVENGCWHGTLYPDKMIYKIKIYGNEGDSSPFYRYEMIDKQFGHYHDALQWAEDNL